jgi:hypothetical protein
VAHHLEQFRAGQYDDAFFGLLESPTFATPVLVEAFRSETEASVRAFLVKVLWERRDPSVLPVLGEALSDRSADVWKEALNGLVTLVAPESLNILRRASREPVSGRSEQDKFGLWLSEAIEQAEETLQRGQRAV